MHIWKEISLIEMLGFLALFNKRLAMFLPGTEVHLFTGSNIWSQYKTRHRIIKQENWAIHYIYENRNSTPNMQDKNMKKNK